MGRWVFWTLLFMADAVTLRPALATDLPAMAAVEQSAYPAAVHEGAGVLGAHLSLDPKGAWVACAAGGAVVGYILSHPLPLVACPMEIDGQPLADGARPAAETLYLHDIAVLPQFRAAGAGLRPVSSCRSCCCSPLAAPSIG